MIRKAADKDFYRILGVINNAAEAYRGKIPADCWHEPYMREEYLRHEVELAVDFWVYEENMAIVGVMGIQDLKDVSLIRHAYVQTTNRNRGIGTKLIQFICSRTQKPILVGTWKAAVWAVRFYEKHGFTLVSEEEKNKLLKKYWTIPDRQIETSVVLVDRKFFAGFCR